MEDASISLIDILSDYSKKYIIKNMKQRINYTNVPTLSAIIWLYLVYFVLGGLMAAGYTEDQDNSLDESCLSTVSYAILLACAAVVFIFVVKNLLTRTHQI